MNCRPLWSRLEKGGRHFESKKKLVFVIPSLILTASTMRYSIKVAPKYCQQPPWGLTPLIFPLLEYRPHSNLSSHNIHSVVAWRAFCWAFFPSVGPRVSTQSTVGMVCHPERVFLPWHRTLVQSANLARLCPSGSFSAFDWSLVSLSVEHNTPRTLGCS